MEPVTIGLGVVILLGVLASRRKATAAPPPAEPTVVDTVLGVAGQGLNAAEAAVGGFFGSTRDWVAEHAPSNPTQGPNDTQNGSPDLTANLLTVAFGVPTAVAIDVAERADAGATSTQTGQALKEAAQATDANARQAAAWAGDTAKSGASEADASAARVVRRFSPR